MITITVDLEKGNSIKVEGKSKALLAELGIMQVYVSNILNDTVAGIVVENKGENDGK